MAFTEQAKTVITVSLTGGEIRFVIDPAKKVTIIMRGVDKFTEKNASVESEPLSEVQALDFRDAVERVKDLVTA